MSIMQEIMQHWTEAKINNNLDRNTFEHNGDDIYSKIIYFLDSEIESLKELDGEFNNIRIEEAEHIQAVIKLLKDCKEMK